MKHPLFVISFFLLCFALFGCLSESAVEQVTVATRLQLTQTAVITPAPLPTAVPTEIVPPAPPERTLVDNLTAVSADAIAYVQDKQLFIRILPNGNSVLVQEDNCPENRYCIIHYLKWSPDRQFLLFYYHDAADGLSSLHISDRQGNVQTIADVAPFRPGAWSPNGRSIAFMRQTGIRVENIDNEMSGWRYEVWTISFNEDGVLGTAQLVGPWTQMGDGCGGGGRSQSENLYENEGGTSYGYLMGVMEWTPQNILLYTTNCENNDIGRYDLTTQAELPSFDRPLRNLVLNNSGDRWYAITGRAWVQEPGSHELVTGTPDSTEVTLIPTSAAVELLFLGRVSGTLYYTERTALGREEMRERNLFFAFYQAALWRIQPDGSGEEQLWLDEADHAYAQVAETAVGDILFVRVENERPLYNAGQLSSLTNEQLEAYYPQRHIVQIAAISGEQTTILSNAGQPTVAIP